MSVGAKILLVFLFAVACDAKPMQSQMSQRSANMNDAPLTSTPTAVPTTDSGSAVVSSSSCVAILLMLIVAIFGF